MKKIVILILSILSYTVYAQDPFLDATLINGTGIPPGTPAGSPFAPGEGVSFRITTGSLSGSLIFPPPANAPYQVNITTLGMGMPVVTIVDSLSTGNYFLTPTVTQVGPAGTYVINITQDATVLEEQATTFLITGIATGESGAAVGYQGNLAPGGYISTNIGLDNPSSNGVIDSSLPVTLASFMASKEGSVAQLNWVTASESNSGSFDIERSGNGKKWSVIGNKRAEGNSSINVNYSFTDNSPLNGENLYRLKMIDMDGTFAFSHIETLKFDSENFKLYPNPVVNSEKLQIDVRDWNRVQLVKIVNSMGKVVFESAGSLASGVTTNNMSSGLYMVQVVQKDGQIITSKFVKL